MIRVFDMTISQKCQYAVRAILELAKGFGKGPIKVGHIAARQDIPPRFLEGILNELRQGGFVQSQRGAQGGYMLMMRPDEISVGQIIRFVDGPLDPVACISNKKGAGCPLMARCALVDLWTRARQALEEGYDGTTFEELARKEADLDRSRIHDYCI
jgi:Rrf2 family transcriptional regulator, cysteine metabolism repressor